MVTAGQQTREMVLCVGHGQFPLPRGAFAHGDRWCAAHSCTLVLTVGSRSATLIGQRPPYLLPRGVVRSMLREPFIIVTAPMPAQ
jgi:hypothetical protein